METARTATTDGSHLAVIFRERVERHGDRTALRHRVAGVWKDISWRALGEEVRAVAKALVEAGVGEGETVGIFATNRPEWTVADLAVQQIRAVSVPIYPTSTARQAQYIVNDAEVKVLFVGSQDGYDKIISFFPSNPFLERIVVMDESVVLTDPAAVPYRDFVAAGKGSARDAEVDARLARASGDDLLTLIYTSGTTGEPKGVMLTHASFSATASSHDFRLLDLDEKDVSLCFLPLSHVFERAWTFYALYKGMTNCYCDEPADVVPFLQDVRPTVMCAVPRFYEKIYGTVLDRLESAPPLRRKLFWWAIRVGAERGRLYKEQEPLPPWLRLRYLVADRLVLSKIRAIVGGRIRFFPCAGAPLSQEIEEFFYAAGIFICYGYGLTETTATVSCHEPFHFKFGTVGKPIQGVEVKIAENGEILVRGKTVMKGYYKKPKETAEVFTEGGWFRTGDAGVIEEGGFLRITERIKDLMKTSGGKYVAPQLLESLIGADHLVEQVAVVGDGRNYVTALIVPSFGALEGWARGAGIPFADRSDLVGKPQVVELYRRRVDERSRDLARFEQIKKFVLLPEAFSVEGGEITPTLKIRRKVVAEKYRKEIDALYAGD